MVETEGGSQPSRYPQWCSCIRERKRGTAQAQDAGISEDWKMSIVPRAVWETEAGNTWKDWGPGYTEMLSRSFEDFEAFGSGSE